MKKLLIIIGLIFSSDAFAIDCLQHPIYCQIRDNNPKLDKKYMMKLSNLIRKVSKKYNINSNIYTAILAQESLYELSAVNCTKGFRDAFPGEVNIQVYPYYKEGKVCTDFGISQIHWKTIKSYSFDVDKLTSDLEYSVGAGAIVLRDMKKRYHYAEKDYWTRYNSSNESKRNAYKQLVERFL